MEKETISYFVHESIVARMERHSKRLFVLCVIMFISLVGSNLAWLLYESQYEDVVTETQTVTQESTSDGGDAIINGEYAGAIIYGESETDNNKN